MGKEIAILSAVLPLFLVGAPAAPVGDKKALEWRDDFPPMALEISRLWGVTIVAPLPAVLKPAENQTPPMDWLSACQVLARAANFDCRLEDGLVAFTAAPTLRPVSLWTDRTKSDLDLASSFLSSVGTKEHTS